MTLITCPACAATFKMRARGRCPACATLLLVGRELYEVMVSQTRGYYWDHDHWIPLAELVNSHVAM